MAVVLNSEPICFIVMHLSGILLSSKHCADVRHLASNYAAMGLEFYHHTHLKVLTHGALLQRASTAICTQDPFRTIAFNCISCQLGSPSASKPESSARVSKYSTACNGWRRMVLCFNTISTGSMHPAHRQHSVIALSYV